MTPAAPAESPTSGKYCKLHTACRWTWRSLTWFTLIVAVLGVLHILWTNHRGKAEAARVIQLLHDRGIPPKPSAELPEDVNAARFYHAAADLFVLPQALDDKVPEVSISDWPLFGEGFSEEQADVLQQAVEHNRLAYETVFLVGPGAQVDFNFDPVAEFLSTLDTLAKVRQLSRWFVVGCHAATATGDLDLAVDHCEAIYRLSCNLGSDEYLIVGLVRISIVAAANACAEELLSRATLDPIQITRLQAAMQYTRARLHFPNTLQREIGLFVAGMIDPDWAMIQSEYMGRHVAKAWAQTAAIMLDEEFNEEDLFQQSTLESIERAAMRTYDAWCPGAARLEAVRAIEPVLALYDEVSDPATPTSRLIEISFERSEADIMSGLKAALRTYMLINAELDAAIAAMDVEKFRLRENRWPNNLAEIYSEIPRGIFDHELKTIHDSHEFRTYSLGANGQDELGIDRHHNQSVTDEEDDAAFILLDPSHRARPATTAIQEHHVD